MKLVAPLVAALAIAACSSGGSSNVPTSGASQTGGSASTRIPEWQAKHLARYTCPQIVGKPSCLVLQPLKNGAQPPPCNPSATCGWTPAELEAAYDLTPYLGNGSG